MIHLIHSPDGFTVEDHGNVWLMPLWRRRWGQEEPEIVRIQWQEYRSPHVEKYKNLGASSSNTKVPVCFGSSRTPLGYQESC